jgi:hypothetical protein
MDIAVVLPAPLCPSSAVICPLYMSRFILLTATFRPLPDPNSCKTVNKLKLSLIVSSRIFEGRKEPEFVHIKQTAQGRVCTT